MGRPSKLSPDQWAEIERRLNMGESAAVLSREFGVSQPVISNRFSKVSKQVKKTAEMIAASQSALAELPVAQQYQAISLADKLRSISSSLACAAELGAKTAHRLHSLANSEVAKVDDAYPLQSIDALKGVSALTKLGNDSAAIALNLLAANKESVKTLNEEAPRRSYIDASKVSSQSIEELLTARDESALPYE